MLWSVGPAGSKHSDKGSCASKVIVELGQSLVSDCTAEKMPSKKDEKHSGENNNGETKNKSDTDKNNTDKESEKKKSESNPDNIKLLSDDT